MMKQQMEVPIILFVYNRAEHVSQVLKYLNDNEGIAGVPFYIFSDGPKQGEEEKVQAVRTVLKSFRDKNNFAQVQIIESEINKGLANSVISGVTQILEKYSKVIVLEDDLLTAKDFYHYMKDALEYYEEDRRVWSITGYSPQMRRLERTSHEVYTSPRAGSWGWGTWKNRWETIDWSVSDYKEFKDNAMLRKKFDKRSPGMSHMLDLQMCGQIDSWAIRWCYQQHKNGMYTINPVRSKILNIGNDGSGTHNETDDKWSVNFTEVTKPTMFEPMKIDKRVFREYNKYFKNPIWRRVYKRLRRILKGTI